ncbi:hypothetical protein ACA29_12580 [Lederbergia galactosidilytica]|uniref:Uncharacterized protein n=2 Tax=Lederbergia galactosidilytica TaxID=217031 RepID=A0A0Q9Y406_9BACI|nr:hypothetical protein ACA29_12580 [Lederbergia galactosidilytica]
MLFQLSRNLLTYVERKDWMRKNYETKHIFMAIAICFILASPIIIIYIPMMFAQFFHYTPKVWQVFVPMENYLVCAVGLIFLIAAFFLLFFLDFHKKSIAIFLLLLVLSIASFYIMTQSYQRLAEDHLSYQQLFTTHQYSYRWEDVKEVRQTIEKEGHSKYTFVFHDGNNLTIGEDGYFKEIKNKVINTLENNKIEFVQIRLE